MRLAVLADIHGNLHALEATLAHIEARAVDEVIVAGDIVNGMPFSRACWTRVRDLGLTALRGNHERYLLDYGTPRADAAWATERFRPLEVTRSQFGDEDLAQIGNLPHHLRREDLLITHASYRSDYDTMREDTPDEALRAMFAGSGEPFVVRAHNHVWLKRTWDGRCLVSIGAAGLPLNGRPEAQYLLAERRAAGWTFVPQFVPYDVTAALTAMRNGYLETAGPVARLFYRELETARWQLIPFYQAYGAALDAGELTLEGAVSRYLAE